MSAQLMLGAIKSVAKTYDNLKSLIRPVSADQPESMPHVFFDTQLYPQAGLATGFLQFYQAGGVSADNTLSNFANGILEQRGYFEIHRMFVWIHAVPNVNAGVVAGAANDVELLHKTARGNVAWNTNSRPYGGFPIWFFGRPGGPVPSYAGIAAANSITAGETDANGGFPINGNQVIPPQQAFKCTMQFVPLTAISAATYITHAMLGVYHRPL